jgi:hypothetical protein
LAYANCANKPDRTFAGYLRLTDERVAGLDWVVNFARVFREFRELGPSNKTAPISSI